MGAAVVALCALALLTPAQALPDGWGDPVLIDPLNGGDVSHPQVVSAANGTAIAVWERSNGSVYSMWSARFDPGAGWGSAALIEWDDAGDVDWPSLVMDPSGNAIAVWAQSDGTLYNLWTNRYNASAGWGLPILLETNSSGNTSVFTVATDANGNAFVVWEQSDGVRHNIWASRFDATSSLWGNATLIETDDAGDADSAIVAMDPAGNAVAVWSEYNGSVTTRDIWANAYNVTSGWGNASRIEDGSLDAREPVVAMDKNGNAVATWTQTDIFVFSIWANTYSPSAGWGTAGLIETIDAGSAFGTQVGVTAEGDALAVWFQFNGPTAGDPSDIWANRYNASSGWGTAGIISENATISAFWPQVEVSPNGDAIAVWQQNEGGPNDIWANRYNASAGWGNATLIETNDTGMSLWKSVAVDARGNEMVVWESQNGTLFNAWSNRYGADDTIAPGLVLVEPADGTVTNISSIRVVGTTEPGARVWVDGVEATVEANGSFEVSDGLVPGDHTINVSAFDDAGNRRTILVNVTYRPPPTLPAILVLAPANNSEIPAGTVLSFDISDPEGIQGASYDSPAGSGTLALPYQISTAGWPEGPLNVTVTAIDAVGNVSNVTFHFVLDSVAPSISLASPANGSRLRPGSNLTFTILDANAFGVVWVEGAAPLFAPFQLSTLGWSDGTRNVTITATDGAGNQRSETFQFLIDGAPPSIALTAPLEGSVVAPGTQLIFAVADPVLETVLWLNGSAWTLLPPPYALSTRGWPDGAANLSLTATDAVGNTRTATFRVTLDGTAPSLTLESPPNGTAVSTGAVIRISVFDPNLDAVRWNNGSGWTVLLPPFEIDTSRWPEGETNLSVEASDLAGNVNAIALQFRFLTVGSGPPGAPPSLAPPGNDALGSRGFEAGLTGVLLLAAAVVVTTSSRAAEAVSAAVFLPLFTRLRRDEVRNQVSRGRIIQFVNDNPGASFSQVRRHVELSGASCVYHLRLLEKAGEVHRIAEGASVRFYRPGKRKDAEALPSLSYLARRILEAVVEMERPTLREIAQALEARGVPVTDKNLGYHLKVLAREKRLLETGRVGRKSVYYVNVQDRDGLKARLTREAQVDHVMAAMTISAPPDDRLASPPGRLEGRESGRGVDVQPGGEP